MLAYEVFPFNKTYICLYSFVYLVKVGYIFWHFTATAVGLCYFMEHPVEENVLKQKMKFLALDLEIKNTFPTVGAIKSSRFVWEKPCWL